MKALVLLLLVLQQLQSALCVEVDHGSAQSGEPPVLYFHQLNHSACDGEMLAVVNIEGQEGRRVSLKLTESSREFLAADAPADSQFVLDGLGSRPCFYQGQLVEGGTPVVAKLSRDGLFSATFDYNGTVYEVRPQSKRLAVFLGNRLPKLGGTERRCPLAAKSAVTAAAERPIRSRQSALLMDTRSGVAQPAQKFIQLVLVSDEAYFIGMGRDSARTQDRLWEIGNYINSLYKQLGVNVVIVRAIVLTTDPFTLANKTSAVSSSEMLDKFMAYRMQNLSHIQHSAAHLVSGLRMTGSDVGLAHLGKLCQFAYGGGVNSDLDIAGSAINVAVTVAHELGHNLGMNHDEDDVPCSCPDPQGCIMKAVGGEINPLRFSTCSVNRYLEFTVDAGLGYCMSRPPEPTVKLSTDGPKCGNRILEAGEDCDCGLAAWCNNSCCNPTTCKFNPGASCASGQCCNITTCSLISRGTECRAARGVCDLPEFCNGSSEWCPEFDDYVLDGTACAVNPAAPSEALAYCYSGACTTRDSRCHAMFNGTNYRSAPDSFSNLTADPSNTENGYCNYRATAYNPVGYAHESCSFENRRCGTLYCIGIMSEPFPMPRWKSMAPADARLVMVTSGGGGLDAAFARLDLRPTGYRDPGMTPDGAECGAGMMCVNSRCTSLASIRSNITGSVGLPNCNGRGNWTQSLQCFCSSGFRPPDCLLPGAGGSVTNQPAFADTSSSPVTTLATATATTTATTAAAATAVSDVSGQTTISNPVDFSTSLSVRINSTLQSSSTTAATMMSSPAAGGTDSGLYIGIGVAAAIVFLLLVVGVSYLLWRRCRAEGRTGKDQTDSPADSGGGLFVAAAGPPAHLSNFYDSIRDLGKRRDSSLSRRKYWPAPPPEVQADVNGLAV
ncbi:hypothetical protein BOX15_Mlig004074g3 [Macrostomum lignano]|uniref:Peptidase M12B domain-containing protein n=1 Tax=Macrostomum lignano TaxID=282301 RepID=A0A267DUG8_9PLAT|nr:hypothetical protein BOX15_Mlig004074g3 [Macrostomum lignano]